MKENLKNYMHKDYFESQIIKMHCVGHFIMLMMTNKLIKLFKSCIVFFVTTIKF
jgi:hypothetical protein